MTASTQTQSSPYHQRVFTLACFMVGLASLFYVYEFFLRVIPTVITHELLRDLHINATQLGFLGVSFYLAYTPMQIPAGLLLDRFGPRTLLTWAVFLCSLATLWFAHTDVYGFACLTRFLIGAASAFAFIGPLTLAANWLPSRYFALTAGLIQLMGCVGAMIGGEPIARLTNTLGWQPTLWYAGAIGLLLTILFGLMIRNHPKGQSQTQTAKALSLWSGLQQVCQNRQNWFTGIAGFACWAPIVVFAELWGVAFLKRAYHLDAIQAASLINWLWVGVAVASPLGGWLSDRMRSRKKPLWVCFGTAIVSSSVILWQEPPLPQLHIWLFLLGASAAAQPITFGLIRDNNAPTVASTAMGFNNMCVIAAASMQWVTGFLLDLNWEHHMHDGARIFSLHNYQHALLVIPLCSALGLLATTLAIRETQCQPQYE